MVGFVESVQRQADEQVAQKIATKIKRGRELDLVDLRSQLEQIQALGGIGSLLDKLPGVNPAALQASGFDERQIRRQIGIINSMTPRERRHPALIDGSRKRRIAAGAGLSLQDVNRLLKQHKLLAKTMKRVSKGGGMQQLLENVRRPRDGFPGGRR
jgi:signal recognition particle subunit SRP54